MHEMLRFKKGQRVIPSGYGRTANWPKIPGTVSSVRPSAVFVRWDGTTFEDEMLRHEITEEPTGNAQKPE